MRVMASPLSLLSLTTSLLLLCLTTSTATATAAAAAVDDCSRAKERIMYTGAPVLSPPAPLPLADTFPKALVHFYTRCGAIPTASFLVDDRPPPAAAPRHFAKHEIDTMVASARRVLASGRYPRKDMFLFEALAAHAASAVAGKHVGVYGSMSPWHEAALLALGAAHVTSIDYRALSYDHPSLSTLTLSNLTSSHLFDSIVSASTFDHDGLGRYGDALDPDADLRAMDSAALHLRPGGLLFLTLPVGPDLVVWNLHRRYGARRLPLMLRGWRVQERVGWREAALTEAVRVTQSFEPCFVLSHGATAEEDRQEL